MNRKNYWVTKEFDSLFFINSVNINNLLNRSMIKSMIQYQVKWQQQKCLHKYSIVVDRFSSIESNLHTNLY